MPRPGGYLRCQEIDGSHVAPGHERVLSPLVQALEHSQAPTMLAKEVGLSTPASLLVTASDWDLNTFGRRHGWRVWLCSTDGPTQPDT